MAKKYNEEEQKAKTRTKKTKTKKRRKERRERAGKCAFARACGGTVGKKESRDRETSRER